MKKIFLGLLAAAIFLSQSKLGSAQEHWHDLGDDEEYVADYILDPGDSKTVTIYSEKEVQIGFKTNATGEQINKYKKDKSHKVSFIQDQTGKGMIGVSSAGESTFSPIDEKIVITLSNTTNETFKMIVYRTPKTTR